MRKLESSDSMRLRNLKDKDILLDSCSYLVKNPLEYKGNWASLFGNINPIHLEIGMGKGDFIVKMALDNPNINFIGIEKHSNVLARALKKYPDKYPNLVIINMDAIKLEDVFCHEIDTLYLNFSDPWPKERCKNRRLTSPVFLDIYENIFKDKKRIVMKTDNLILFQSSIVNLSQAGYIFKEVSLDLEHSSILSVLTEYEKKFREKNIKINYLEAIK